MSVRVLEGDCRELLPTLAERSVQCVVTSPPYFGLRRYLPAGHPDAEREIGQEQTPAAYVEALVAVFREVRRVLRDDGTLWLNIAPSYAGSTQTGGTGSKETGKREHALFALPKRPAEGYKPKDMIPTPWLVGIALQQDGWYLRAPIIWHKPNAMPSSVTDRPTLDYEYVLLLSKQERYFYDAQAIAEASVTPGDLRAVSPDRTQAEARTGGDSRKRTGNPTGLTRNARMVWSINTQPYTSGQDVDHFAVMPEKLVERCLLAATSPRACPTCRAPWRRVVERRRVGISIVNAPHMQDTETLPHSLKADPTRRLVPGVGDVTETTGWQPTCSCPDNDGSGRCVVLDPFGGSGTTARVATRHGRDAVLIELNPQYIGLMDERTAGVQMILESVV